MLTADDTLSLDMRWAPVADRRQRNFWIALTVALLVHAALLAEISRGVLSEREVRRLGSESGSDNAIAVELVTAADLKSLSSVATDAGGGPPPQKQPVESQEVPKEQPPPPETPPAPEPTPEPKAAEPPPEPLKEAEPKEAEAKPAEPTVTAEAKPESQETTPVIPPFETTVEPNLATAETPKPPAEPKKAEPAEKQEQPEPKPQPKPETVEKQAKQAPPPPPKKKQQQAKLDLSLPPQTPSTMGAGPGRATAATRPPGITRSGENDQFGIAAIRALAQTFPMLNDTYGRVTVKLLLNQNGDLVNAQVVQSSGKPKLDQSVIFSAKQASFPLPPRNSTEIDRTFIVTYVYR